MTTKKHAATLLILMVVGLTSLVNAQTKLVMKAQVPFDFMANGKMIPAGQCIIEGVDSGRPVLVVKSGTRVNWLIAIEDQSVKDRAPASLVFHRYGDRYFLAAIRRTGKVSYQLPATKFEKELRAQNNVVEEQLTLLASAE